MTTLQQQYISEWHDSFVNFIGGLLSFVESLIVLPDTTEKIRVENLYALLCQQRHRIFHLDPFSPILLDKENALDIVEETLKRMNDTY